AKFLAPRRRCSTTTSPSSSTPRSTALTILTSLHSHFSASTSFSSHHQPHIKQPPPQPAPRSLHCMVRIPTDLNPAPFSPIPSPIMPPQLRSSCAPLTATKIDFSFTCHCCSAEFYLFGRALPASAAAETLHELHQRGMLPSPLYQWHCPLPCRHRACAECVFKVRRSVCVDGGVWITAEQQEWAVVRPVWLRK
ncbi:hypothetical protein BZA05DRAFT_461690, partial [Tricharina praecox]|uniref:uncharacterized protein n=1 Tax=Tricharina praecox TaxID=43433 RepID=UPI00222022F8